MKTALLLPLLICLLFFGSLYSQAQCPVPNGGFENWVVDDEPDNWYGTLLSKIPGRTGGFAVQIDTFSMVPVPGILGSVFACSTRSNFLNGYLKADFSQSPTDSLMIIVYQKLVGQEVPGKIGSCVTNTSQANWTPFHVPLQDFAAGAIDSTSISIIRFGSGKSPIAFDDISISNSSIGQPFGLCQITTASFPVFNKLETVKIFPNPVQTELFIQSGSAITEVSIFDGMGRLVLKSENPGSSISVANLPKGIYVGQIKTGKQLVFKRFLKQ